jgi:hypothetical protein
MGEVQPNALDQIFIFVGTFLSFFVLRHVRNALAGHRLARNGFGTTALKRLYKGHGMREAEIHEVIPAR